MTNEKRLKALLKLEKGYEIPKLGQLWECKPGVEVCYSKLTGDIAWVKGGDIVLMVGIKIREPNRYPRWTFKLVVGEQILKGFYTDITIWHQHYEKIT